MPGKLHLSVRIVSRRDLLRGAGAAVGVAALAGCERALSPSGDTDDTGNTATADDTGQPPADLPESLDPVLDAEDFYVTSCCGTPSVDPDTWTLSIVDRTAGQETLLATVDLAGLQALGGRDKEHTLQCIGARPSYQAIGNAVWTGLPLVEIFTALGVTVPAGALWLDMKGADAYTDNVPIEDLDSPMWLVWAMNGQPLTADHGTTVRVLTPGRYGVKNPKWLVELSFIDQPTLGYWQQRGWDEEAAYNTNALIASPQTGTTVPAGPVRLLGIAFAGSDPVTLVEVSLDGAQTWTVAELTYPGGPDVWTLWALDWEATPGEHRIQVRATTASGATSDPSAEGTDWASGYDGSMEIKVLVT